jgi:LmbE family N-acetylglucosaminyl deacetylase
MLRSARNLALTLFVLILIAAGSSAQVRPVYSYGAAGLGHLLQRLPTTASVLQTGAHPDDEDSALVARLARGDHARVAYLSLTRGGGGQNVIGPELFEALGIIRTEELLQARRLDGGEQLFTRAFDFGFSKTRTETAQRWDERVILDDMVRAIRMYRPLVVISSFTDTARSGHGHHQFAGYLTPIAFHLAGDPSQYPQHRDEGLCPWQPLKLYVRSRGREEDDAVLSVPTGIYDPLIGRSYAEIAFEGRSQHKSQGMGTVERRGERSSSLRLVESHVSTPLRESHIFDGIDTSLGGLSRLLGLPDGLVDDDLSRAQVAAENALADYNPLEPRGIIPHLAEGLSAIRTARETVKGAALADDARCHAEFLLDSKESEFAEALQRAAGVVVDALSEVETVVRGESIRIVVRVFYPAGSPVAVDRIELRAPAGWKINRARSDTAESQRGAMFIPEKGREEVAFLVEVAPHASVTTPYWLKVPRRGDLYFWPDDSPKGRPFGPPLIEAVSFLNIGGAALKVDRPVEYRYADPARGEIRRELNVVPALSVSPDSNLLVVPKSSLPGTKRIAVRVETNSRGATSGTIGLELPPGWSSEPRERTFSLARAGEANAVFFDLGIPGDTASNAYPVKAVAISDQERFVQEMQTIAYPHIQTHRFYTPAEVMVQVLDLEVAKVRVGYIMGSGDHVPEAIRRLGLDIELLGENDLATGDLAQFDVIVVGIRASSVRPDFVANNGRLLEFVRQGGTLIVQYQRPDYVAQNLTPYPAGMSRPEFYSNYRVTDETATVRILQPEHRAFNFPNRITEADWEGWVQERSLYHLTDLDPRYETLLEAADPGEEPHGGGLVYAEVGQGIYVYTGYSFFRQLPAGVPGAYRLFANLLSLGS